MALHGRALFSGGPATLLLLPGRPGAGWRWAVGGGRFRDLGPDDLAPLPHRSTLRGRAVLPEHAFAALLLLDVDDCDVRFVTGEAPILDGSAACFVRAIRAAGVLGPPPRRGPVVEVRFGGRVVTWRGGTGPSAARTFVDASFAAASRGLFPGARPGCAIVLRAGSALYGGRPRMPDEPAWHKLLDVLGDLGCWRARGRISGLLSVCEPSHESNLGAIARAFRQGRLASA